MTAGSKGRHALTTALFATAISIAVAGCDNNTSTPTSPTTTTPTVAEPSISETFDGSVAVGGYTFYSFTVGSNGTVNVTLNAVSGTAVPATVWLGLGIGTPSAEDCSTTATANSQAGTTPQLTGTYAPGVYCARVWDIGNLVGAASFTVTIAHP